MNDTQSGSHHIHACHECDLLMHLPAERMLETKLNNTVVTCPRCKSTQFTYYKNALEHSIAFCLSALVFLIIANSFPFLSMTAQGQTNTITVFQASYQLFTQGFMLLGLCVLAFAIVLPAVYLICLLALLVPIKLKQTPASPILLGKIISTMLPWSMAEVFIVGVLVALIKMIELADIIFGPSFWAYVGFVIFFVAVANVNNKQQLWRWVEYAK